MSEMTIEVAKRETKGKNANRRLRGSGKIPAVLYGGGRESVPIEVDRKTVLDLLKKSGSENAVFLLRLAGSGGKERHAMIRELQVDPIERSIVHIDFQRIEMTKKVRVEVQVELQGLAYGVKNEAGILDFVSRALHVECLPGDIPAHLTVDVSGLHVGQHIEAGQLELPAGVTLLDDAHRVIASVSHARAEAAPAVAEEVAAEAAEPEVIKKGGKPEEAA